MPVTPRPRQAGARANGDADGETGGRASRHRLLDPQALDLPRRRPHHPHRRRTPSDIRSRGRTPARPHRPAALPPRGRRARGGGVLVRISGRNRLQGIVDEVRREGLVAQVRLRIGDQWLTAVITRDAVDELGLKRGDEATALIKATEVMIAKEAPPREPPAQPPTQPRFHQ